MPFYWYDRLPESVWDFDLLEDIIVQRYNAYHSFDPKLAYDIEDVDCADSVGHRFMCILANEVPLLREVVCKGELRIFIERLNLRSVEDLKKELSLILGFLGGVFSNNSDENKGYGRLDVKIIKKLKLVQFVLKTAFDKADHVFDPKHKPICRKLKMLLPFTFTLKLVSKREVELKNGDAAIPCSKWRILLEAIFEYLLQAELDVMIECKKLRSAIHETEDDRIRQLIKRSFIRLNGNYAHEHCVQEASELDEESRFFPPCMANLHQILRKTHRLSYESRYQYTLFLKDIGLPVEESLAFWEEEYRKPQAGASCAHDWEEKERRYKYQIRHLYGLIGSHDKRTSHRCSKFIEPLQSKMDGGCPFQHWSSEAVEVSIPHEMPDIEEIMNFKRLRQPQKACAAYLKCHQNALTNLKRKSMAMADMKEIASPLQFYYLAKEIEKNLNEG